jgi:hypothetical protein
LGTEPSCCALMLGVSAASLCLSSFDKRGKLYPTAVDVERSNLGVAEGMKKKKKTTKKLMMRGRRSVVSSLAADRCNMLHAHHQSCW